MYSKPLKAVTRKVNDNLVVVSCPFRVKGRYNLGGRMMAVSYDKKNVLLYSALPYEEVVKDALYQLTGTKDYQITHVIITNVQHNLVAESYKDHFPKVKLIGTDILDFSDIKFTNDMANQVLTGPQLAAIGIDSPAIQENVLLVYLSYHKNKELVMLEKTSKSLFVCDCFLNIHSGTLELYCPELGFSEGYTPLTGFSYMLRWFNPSSWLWKLYFCPKINRLEKPEALEGLKVVGGLDFERIEVIHGDPVEENARGVFRELFGLEDLERVTKI